MSLFNLFFLPEDCIVHIFRFLEIRNIVRITLTARSQSRATLNRVREIRIRSWYQYQCLVTRLKNIDTFIIEDIITVPLMNKLRNRLRLLWRRSPAPRRLKLGTASNPGHLYSIIPCLAELPETIQDLSIDMYQWRTATNNIFEQFEDICHRLAQRLPGLTKLHIGLYGGSPGAAEQIYQLLDSIKPLHNFAHLNVLSLSTRIRPERHNIFPTLHGVDPDQFLAKSHPTIGLNITMDNVTLFAASLSRPNFDPALSDRILSMGANIHQPLLEFHHALICCGSKESLTYLLQRTSLRDIFEAVGMHALAAALRFMSFEVFDALLEAFEKDVELFRTCITRLRASELLEARFYYPSQTHNLQRITAHTSLLDHLGDQRSKFLFTCFDFALQSWGFVLASTCLDLGVDMDATLSNGFHAIDHIFATIPYPDTVATILIQKLVARSTLPLSPSLIPRLFEIKSIQGIANIVKSIDPTALRDLLFSCADSSSTPLLLWLAYEDVDLIVLDLIFHKVSVSEAEFLEKCPRIAFNAARTGRSRNVGFFLQHGAPFHIRDLQSFRMHLSDEQMIADVLPWINYASWKRSDLPEHAMIFWASDSMPGSEFYVSLIKHIRLAPGTDSELALFLLVGQYGFSEQVIDCTLDEYTRSGTYNKAHLQVVREAVLHFDPNFADWKRFISAFYRHQNPKNRHVIGECVQIYTKGKGRQ